MYSFSPVAMGMDVALADEPVSLVVVWIHRLLEPVDVVRLDLARQLDRLVVAVGAVGVDHDLHVGADGLADNAHPLHVLVYGRSPHLHLDRSRAEGHRPLHLGRQLLEALALLVVTAGDVYWHPCRRSPRAACATASRDLCSYVPERDVDAADHPRGYASPAHELRLPHVVPDPLGVKGVLSDSILLQVLENTAADVLGLLDRAGQPDAGYTLVGVDLDDIQARRWDRRIARCVSAWSWASGMSPCGCP